MIDLCACLQYTDLNNKVQEMWVSRFQEHHDDIIHIK